MRFEKSLTAKHSLLQSCFWMNFCCCLTYAAFYMQSVGYSNTSLGIIVALGNIFGAILSPYLTSLVSKGLLGNLASATLSLAVQLACLVILVLTDKVCMAFSSAYVVLIAFCYPSNSLDLDLYAECLEMGVHVDFGIARGMGSAGFVFISLVLGIVTGRFPARSVAVVGMCVVVLQILAHVIFMSSFNRYRREGAVVRREDYPEEKATGLLQFAFTYGRFTVMILGIIVMLSGFRIGSSYLVNMVRHVGGDSRAFSMITSYGAAIEIPMMILCSWAIRKFRPATVILVSFIFFALKMFLFAVSASVPFLYFAISFHGPSYAVYSAAIVPFVSQIMPAKDSPVAQSLVFTALTVSYVIGSVTGGIMLDHLAVPTVMFICGCVCVLGALIAASQVISLKKGRRLKAA